MKESKKIKLDEHIVEFVCDAGEGAQKAAVSFAKVSAKMGNSLWTVEIIPSEIQPPPHTMGSTSGNRIRLSSKTVTNGGNLTNVVVAFNEMNLLSRIKGKMLADDVVVIIDNKWANDPDETIRKQYREILDELKAKGADIYEVPIEEKTMTLIDNPQRGKNMVALGMLGYLYTRDMDILADEIRSIFKKKSKEIQDNNVALLTLGYELAKETINFQYVIESTPFKVPMVAMNGNEAVALGAVAAGFEHCSMYPITPATSATHALSEYFGRMGGIVHQAEDEIAAIGVALGSYYAGRTTLTITSGPGMALKTEFLGLTVMTETPLVVVNVQRGGPSTGLPTKIEQGDLLSSLFSTPGDAPKVIMAPTDIEECYHVMITARKIAEEFRMLVIVLTDANLATGTQLYPRPKLSTESFPPPMDMSPIPVGTKPYDWDEETGLSRRIIPGQPGGMCRTTSLNHSPEGKVNHDPDMNQKAHRMRSRKLMTLQKSLKKPEVYGDKEGDLLVVSWGSLKGPIDEAVDNLRKEGKKVGAISLQFLSPFPPGLKEIFSKYKKVMVVELNYSDDWDDPMVNEDTRRYSQLSMLLRSHTLVDVDCFTRVYGRPLMPMEIYDALSKRLAQK
ncbi:MAG: 2-oxoacid:acceptor oxidoreductase subunit alpha [Spirochaetia bacterium]|nr:2-oxoacid:acceptor oxidoreductase subunit alpha [Spirochaetia bacterium]